MSKCVGATKVTADDSRQIVPEAYVWYLFHGLARALEYMDLPRSYKWIDQELVHDVPGSERYILHLDIKAENSKSGHSVPNSD